MKRVVLIPTALCMSLWLAGCISTQPTGPRDQNWKAPIPTTIGASAPAPSTGALTANQEANLDWHQMVKDERLKKLIDLSLANNRDVRVAVANIAAARASVKSAEADRLPTVNASAGTTTTRTGANMSSTGKATVSREHTVSLGISSFEIDLWGRLARLDEAAEANLLSMQATLASVQATLITEVAESWLTLASDQQLLALYEQTYESEKATLALYQKQKEYGAVSALDLATVQASTEAARGNVAAYKTQVAQDLNALRLYLGTEPPQDLLPPASLAAQADTDDATLLIGVPADLPSSVLLKRPDVMAEEYTLAADDADVAAARAALFPTLSLTTSVGTASTALNGLFKSGSGTWSVAPSLTAPIFDGGSLRAAVDSAKATQAAQLATYEKTLQTAFQDVADALAERAHLDERLQAQQGQVDAYQKTLSLTEQQYKLGAATSLSVLDAKRSLWSAQQSLVSLRLTEQTNRLTLFKALGGH
jgi:outer membrane protein, multidrug efflux system